MIRAGRGEAVSGAALGAAGGNGVGNHGDKVALRGFTDGAALPGVFDEALPGRLRHLRHVPARRRPASPGRFGAGVARFALGAVEDRGVRGARRGAVARRERPPAGTWSRAADSVSSGVFCVPPPCGRTLGAGIGGLSISCGPSGTIPLHLPRPVPRSPDGSPRRTRSLKEGGDAAVARGGDGRA
ncbi:hypothetical protein J2Z30_008725 [Streptomyces iranensis]|uniref:Uncharacterized protein n=1 Tax=Streptomyces iranensis TaxID=576784 RepID=A0ABS4N6P4_9ACTN|nr:hypothetical protein [Streptomyces iranensis]